MTAAHLMTIKALTIGPDTTLDEAAGTLSQNNIKELPVTDGLGRVLGLLTIDDVIRTSIGNAAKNTASNFNGNFDNVRNMTAAELAARQHRDTPPVFSCIGPEASLSEVATLLIDGNNRVLMVTDNAARLLGVISAADVIRRLNTDK